MATRRNKKTSSKKTAKKKAVRSGSRLRKAATESASKPQQDNGKSRAAISAAKAVAGRRKLSTTFGLLSESEVFSDVKSFISTGFAELDEVLGGGWPIGRACEVYGPYGSGKSALAYCAIRSVQEQGGTAVILDYEAALTNTVLRQLGIDPDRLVYAMPDNMEAGWELLRETLASWIKQQPGVPLLFVWDSIAMAKTQEQLDAKAGDHTVGSQARMASSQCNERLLKQIQQAGAHVMFVNQVRAKVGAAPFEDPETRPAGNAIDFLTTALVRVKRVGRLPAKVKPKTGYRVTATCEKNRLAPPHRPGYFVIDFNLGPSPELSLFESLVGHKQITHNNAGKYKAPGIVGEGKGKTFTRAEWVKLLREDPDIRNSAEQAIRDIMNAEETGTVVPE